MLNLLVYVSYIDMYAHQEKHIYCPGIPLSFLMVSIVLYDNQHPRKSEIYKALPTNTPVLNFGHKLIPCLNKHLFRRLSIGVMVDSVDGP